METMHFNPKTGNFAKCSSQSPDSCPLTFKYGKEAIHGSDIEDIEDKARAIPEMRFFSVFSNNNEAFFDTHFDKELKELLSNAIAGGFSVASTEHNTFLDDQARLLSSDIILSYYVHEAFDNDDWKALDGLSKAVYARIKYKGESLEEIVEGNILSELTDSQIKKIKMRVRKGYPDEKLASTGGWLFASKKSPLFEKAKSLIKAHDKKQTIPSGYTPSDSISIVKVENGPVMKKMMVSDSMMPNNVVAFDIETDTEQGYGLRSTLAQITEIVISDKFSSIVIKGDEKKMLESFAEIMDSVPQGVELVGWNSRGFDNIFLNTRARLHGIKNWGGRLEDAPNKSRRVPIDSYKKLQKMVWTKTSGEEIFETDALLEKSETDKRGGTKTPGALKVYSKEILGIRPIEVDRANMHDLSEEERKNYIVSDGICTLVCFKHILDRQSDLSSDSVDTLPGF